VPARIFRLRNRPWLAVAALALLGSVVLNVVAARAGHSAPWLLGVNLAVAMLALGAGILAAARFVSSTEAETSRMRDALDASQARLSAIVDSAMDAIITVDAEHRIVLFNRAAEQMFRCSREQALGSPLDRFIPARFRAAHRGHIEQFGQTGVTSRRMGDFTTLWAVRADGDGEFPIEASISQATEDGQRYYTVILRDITVRKRHEDELRQRQAELSRISAQVLEAREEEKTRIARELHDELGQLLTALKMDLGWIRERVGAPDTEIAAKARRMHATLDETVASVRRIAADLRPLMLDDLGLPDAAAWLVEEFEKRSGVRCHWKLDNPAGTEEFDSGTANAVYRALQESLTNIARHSGAGNVWVRLEVGREALRLEVEDDGRGVSAQDLAKTQSLGLKGMRERIHHIGGALEISNPPRGGTRVSLRVPLPEKGAA
jgi:PAS domain S-box-containing protein